MNNCVVVARKESPGYWQIANTDLNSWHRPWQLLVSILRIRKYKVTPDQLIVRMFDQSLILFLLTLVYFLICYYRLWALKCACCVMMILCLYCSCHYYQCLSSGIRNLRSSRVRPDSSRLTNQEILVWKIRKILVTSVHWGLMRWRCLCASDWGRVVFVMLGGMMQVRSWPQECVGMTGVMMLWRQLSWHLCAMTDASQDSVMPQHSGLSRR